VSQDRPIAANEVLNPADSATTRRSQASANDMPAPAATPLTAATTGLGMVASEVAMGA
jgi:hypothetical protein